MISKYLKNLLADNKKVIIPDFGGFVVKRSATGDVISFNSFLKFNDDLLINALKEGEGMDDQQALKLIKDEVTKMTEDLETYGAYDLPGLGSLRRDKKGNVRFMNTPIVVDASETETIVEPVVSQGEDAPLEDEKVVETASKTEHVPSQEENVPPKIKKHLNIYYWLVPLLILVLLGIRQCTHRHDAQDTVAVEQIEADHVKNGFKAKKEHLILSKAEQALKEDAQTIYPSLGQRIAAFFKHLFSKTEEVAPVIESPKSSIATLSGVMAPLAKDTISGILVVADKYISEKGKERYHVIIGSFSEPINAKKLNAQLIDDDYASEILDRYNGFVAVSMGSYPTLDIAMRVCGERLSETPGVWILVK